NCGGMTRRHVLQIAGLGVVGLTLADFLRARERQARNGSPAARKSRDVSCIFLWLDGGPSHFETFDPKPNTPHTIRGPYGTIATRVPGIRVSELLPMLAGHMEKCALIRSMSHRTDAHAPIPMLTGFDGSTTSYGAVIAKLKGNRGDMPPYVHLGSPLG